IPRSPRTPVVASRRSFDESSANRLDAGADHLAGPFAFSGQFSRANCSFLSRVGRSPRMCGIIGYVGSRASKPLLLHGLQRLEYRGYDSAGIALLEHDGLDYVRAVGNLANLKEAAGGNGSLSTTGLGHTRWATHGAVTEQNAHPLTACDPRRLAIVPHGIVENYRELRAGLAANGHSFSSETDAEVVTHLLEDAYDGDLVQAVRAVYTRLE